MSHSIKYSFLVTLLILFCSFSKDIFSQNKRALLIGISDYGHANSGWQNIHGANDADLLCTTLKSKGFSIVKICNKNATAKRIRNEFTSLISKCKSGDYIYLHFSGHGQPFEDMNGDEDDGWDESIIPYDAMMNYQRGRYEGSSHITDDELSSIIRKLRIKVGTKGFVFVVIDACHAGGSSRGDEEEQTEEEMFCRGTKIGFSPHGKVYRPRVNRNGHFIIQSENGLSNVIIIEACRSYQSNFEIKENGNYYGPLSFYLNKVLQTINISPSNEIPLRVKNMMDADRRLVRQNMVYESSIK